MSRGFRIRNKDPELCSDQPFFCFFVTIDEIDRDTFFLYCNEFLVPTLFNADKHYFSEQLVTFHNSIHYYCDNLLGNIDLVKMLTPDSSAVVFFIVCAPYLDTCMYEIDYCLMLRDNIYDFLRNVENDANDRAMVENKNKGLS